jgi:excinuclease ABC subunit A
MIERLNLETASDFARNYYKQFFATSTCDKCNGSRLNQHALAVKINHKNIFEVTALSIEEANK